MAIIVHTAIELHCLQFKKFSGIIVCFRQKQNCEKVVWLFQTKTSAKFIKGSHRNFFAKEIQSK